MIMTLNRKYTVIFYRQGCPCDFFSQRGRKRGIKALSDLSIEGIHINPFLKESRTTLGFLYYSCYHCFIAMESIKNILKYYFKNHLEKTRLRSVWQFPADIIFGLIRTCDRCLKGLLYTTTCCDTTYCDILLHVVIHVCDILHVVIYML